MTIDVAVFNFNGKDVLERTLRSVLASKNVRIGMVYVVDDGSTDGSQKIVDKFEQVTLVQLAKNTKKVNLVRNVGLRATKTDRVLLTDNDIEFLPNCLEQLNQVMDEGKDIVAVVPRLLHMDDRERIYLDSCGFHYIGASAARNRERLVKDVDSDLLPSPTMSSGILLLNKKALPDSFGFDESLPFSWGTDGEFYYRITFMGLRSLINPNAIAYHQAKERTVERAEGHITTRWYMLLTYYSWKTLILLIPVLILYELLLFSFFTVKRIPHLYFKYNWQNLSKLGYIMERRQEIQELRKLKDREILCADDMYITPHLVRNPVFSYPLILFNLFLKGYWNLVKIAI